MNATFGHNNLPSCPENQEGLYQNCSGSFTNTYGGKYFGEWKEIKAYYQEILTYPEWKKHIFELKKASMYIQDTMIYNNGIKYQDTWKNNKA